MDIPGQRYFVSDTPEITAPIEASPVDLWAITPAANVPCFVEFANTNCGVNAAQIERAQLVMRTTSGSGGTALNVRNESNAGPSALFSAQSLVTVPGSLQSGPIWSEDWQQFAPMEIDRRERGILVVPGLTLGLNVASIPTTFSYDVNLIVTEVR